MNPRKLDLNLLLAFDVLMTQRQVTRAAHALNLTQPAMSNVLARLRQLFGDPLLVRTPKGMEPTPRALELLDPVRLALRQVHKVFDDEARFDPATSQREFTMRIGGMNVFLMLPEVMARLEREAPSIRLATTHMPPPETLEALESDRIDFAVSTGLAHGKSIRSASLLEDRLVCLLRRGHPAAQRPLTIKAFMELRHIKMAQNAADSRFVDDDLAKLGMQRKIALILPEWLAVPPLIERTDMVTAISERMAQKLDLNVKFAMRRLPMGPRRFAWTLYWHRRYDQDKAHAWMRDLMRDACSQLARAALKDW